MLVVACSPHLRPIVVSALNTGMRKSEILGLKWQDIDFRAETITVHRTQNNEPRLLPVNQTLYDELHHLPRGLHTPYIFCHENGDRYDTVKRSFKNACRKAAIVDFRFHDLRHTFASHLVMNGTDLKTV